VSYLTLVENFSPVLQSGIADYMQNDKNQNNIVQESEKQKDIIQIKRVIRSFYDSGYETEEIKATILDMKNFAYLKQEIIEILEG